MLALFLVAFFLADTCLGVGAGDQTNIVSPTSRKTWRCRFEASEKRYNATDLIGCINDLASGVLVEGSGRSAGGSYRLTRRPHVAGKQDRFPLSDAIASIFGANQGSLYQFPWTADSPEPVSGHYQSNYPTAQGGSVESSGGSGTDLFSALGSISRHDDLKCVSRILCEMASGVMPGSTYKQSSTFGNFGGYSFLGLLSSVNLPGSSPVLNFAKATVLGYTSKGQPDFCYQAYPKCPRNSDDLVYYLNNHNGGFFRFFNGVHQAETYRPPLGQHYYTRRTDIPGYLASGRKEVPASRPSREESDRTGTGELKFDAPVFTARQDYGAGFFPEETVRNDDDGRVVFPGQEKFDDQASLNRVPKSLLDLQESGTNELSQQNSFPYPRVEHNQQSERDSLTFFERPPRTLFKFPADDDSSTTPYTQSDFYPDEFREEYDDSENFSGDERTKSSTDPTKFFPTA